jgi:hypothetical protein
MAKIINYKLLELKFWTSTTTLAKKDKYSSYKKVYY